MSRSGMREDDGEDNWAFIRFRGSVAASLRGKRGQAALRELLAALDAMPNKRLIAEQLVADGEYCALGVLGAARGISIEELNPEDYDQIAEAFNIAPVMVREIEYLNDEGSHLVTPEQRWQEMRGWVAREIKPTTGADQ